MKKILLSFYIIILFHGCSAKENEIEYKNISPNQTKPIANEEELYQQGFNAYKRGDFYTSSKYLKQLVELKEKIGNKQATAEIYPILALSYQSMGDYKKALIYYKKALEILDDKNLNKTLSYSGIGEIYKDLGVYKKALTNYQKALNIIESRLGKENPNTTLFYDNIGMLYMEMQNYPESLKMLNKSLSIKKRAEKVNRVDMAISYMNLGSVYYRMKNYSKALLYYNKDLNLRIKLVGQKHLATATSYNNIGLVYLDTGNYQKALENLEKALSIQKNIFNSHHIITRKTCSNISMSYRGMKNHQKSYIYAKKAFDSFGFNKNFIVLDNREKLKYLKSTQIYLSNLISSTYFYNNQKAVDNTFNSWLNYKRTIFDTENNLRLLYSKTEDKSIKSKIDKLYTLQRRSARLNQKISNTQQLVQIEKEISQLQVYLNAELNSYKITSGVNSINYKDIQTILKPNELYVDFMKVGTYYYYFIVDKTNHITFKRFSRNQTKEIDDYIQRIREDIGHSLLQDAKRRYSKLYNIIFKNINLKNKTSLIISPDGLLGLIPFEAFYDGKKYLIQKLKIRYIPSGKELVKLYRDNSKTQNSDIVLFADVNFDNKNPKLQETKGNIFNSLTPNNHYLKYSKRDAEIVKKLFPNHTKLFLKERATEENLLKVNAPKILYLSTHGTFLRDKSILNPMLKSIILLDGANESIRQKRGNGIVSGLELAGLNLLGTELVVLSACETGVGEIEDSEGIAGLSKTFMEAGAKNVIMTLWSVNDKKSSELMERFFEGVKRGVSYSDALREAKI